MGRKQSIELGADEVMLQGYGGDEMGAGPRITRAGQNYILHKNEPKIAKRQYIPMPETDIPAGGTAVVSVSPQELFQVQKINLAPQAVGALLVTEIAVGKQSQFISDGKIDSVCFAPDAVSSAIDFDAGEVGNTFAITYENTTAAAITVRPMVIALVAE